MRPNSDGETVMKADRWGAFTRRELDAVRDGLLDETSIDPREDPSFPDRIATASYLVSQIDEHLESL